MKKIYITAYVLTKGILVANAKIDGGMAEVAPNAVSPGMPYMHWYVNRGEWFETAEEARVHAQSVRAKRIVNLKKQIAKLEKMTFPVGGEREG